jgi:hypothetical protein
MFLMLWLACGGEPPDPQITSLSTAITAYERGRTALASGDATAATAAFEEAKAARPDDVLLDAWRAQALEAAGDAAGAVRVLDELLRVRSDFSEARYARARVRLQTGDLPGAAGDVQRVLAEGATTPRAVLRDPAFAAHRGDEGFAVSFDFLPAAAIEVAVAVPDKPPFLRSEFDVRITVSGALEGPIAVEGDVVGPVALVRVVEDDVGREDGDRDRVLTWTLAATGGGTVRAGPFRVSQGADVVTTEVASLETLAPAGHTHTPQRCGLRTPGQLVPSAVPSAWHAGDTWVALPPGTVAEGAVTEPWWVRRDGEARVGLQRLDGVVGEVVVRDRGGERWRGAPGEGSSVPRCVPTP